MLWYSQNFCVSSRSIIFLSSCVLALQNSANSGMLTVLPMSICDLAHFMNAFHTCGYVDFEMRMWDEMSTFVLGVR